MIYKVFYQETKERNPRRENTKVLYLDIDAETESEGRIKTRQLMEEKTPYNVEFIELLSDKHLDYEKETGVFELAEL
ncbi:DNA-dependent RNA polymerase subunit epsilon [Streptococcus didelphis]|uniref:DNA-directed RNA polymerase subunit epsilon n=1 Tax=Streptococcus didelphis TaxID=102886 RepID=A0ABY9LFU5_9STRE|nr:DNA-dependent RNA polymerase subunit epsilon [Streptococcus didelphis]WMB27782.1 DNA-dependent RNA polymerase subunit epsilon [Streptococcus didelphis]WMB29758.1 DNA-dependent RNA polymerase subunit epsilon [Streptococcus didelphis]